MSVQVRNGCRQGEVDGIHIRLINPRANLSLITVLVEELIYFVHCVA